MSYERPRVAIPGVGVVCPAGTDAKTSMATVLAARLVAAPITRCDADQPTVRFAC